MMKRIPFHPFLLAGYSVLFLVAHNIREVSLAVALRPLAVLEAAVAVVFVLVWLWLRDVSRAALVVSLLCAVLLSYGHIHDFLASGQGVAALVGRHRYLGPARAGQRIGGSL